MKELIEALGPWPTLQGIAIGMIVAGIGVWAILRGLQGRGREAPLEDAKQRWEEHKWMEHIHENSFEVVKQLERANDLTEQMLAAMNRFNDSRWNIRQ